jgi:hypothetical protein
MTSQKLFELLEQHRKELNLDIVTYCKAIDLGKTGYYNWKKGIAPKGIEDALKILNFLNVFPKEDI